MYVKETQYLSEWCGENDRKKYYIKWWKIKIDKRKFLSKEEKEQLAEALSNNWRVLWI